jgi:putative alpha-1,2-mannosidase
VPLFDEVKFSLGKGKEFTIKKEGAGKKIRQIKYDDEPIDGWFIQHAQLEKGKRLIIITEE